VSGSTDRVVGEGTAATWGQVVSLVTRAHDDLLATRPTTHGRTDDPDGSRIDRELTAAGILPGDPRLYPASSPEGNGQ